MASKINRKYSCDIKGNISINGDKITVEVEDVEDEVNYHEAKDFVASRKLKA